VGALELIRIPERHLRPVLSVLCHRPLDLDSRSSTGQVRTTGAESVSTNTHSVRGNGVDSALRSASRGAESSSFPFRRSEDWDLEPRWAPSVRGGRVCNPDRGQRQPRQWLSRRSQDGDANPDFTMSFSNNLKIQAAASLRLARLATSAGSIINLTNSSTTGQNTIDYADPITYGSLRPPREQIPIAAVSPTDGGLRRGCVLHEAA